MPFLLRVLLYIMALNVTMVPRISPRGNKDSQIKPIPHPIPKC